MKICIPSKDRASTIFTHLFFDPKDVLIFVEKDQLKEYKIFNPDYTFVAMESDRENVCAAKNFILDYIDEEKMIMANDDIHFIGERNKNGRYSELNDFAKLIEDINLGLDEFVLYGLAEQTYAYFMNRKEPVKRRYINYSPVDDFYGINLKWIKTKNIKYDENFKDSDDDIDFNCSVIINEGKICKDYFYSMKRENQNRGGKETYRGITNTDQRLRIQINKFYEKYGYEFFKVMIKKDGNIKMLTANFNNILKRPEIAAENIKKYYEKIEKNKGNE